jgi:hypothetical protein
MGKYLKNVTVIALAIATMITNHKTLQFTILCQYKHHNVLIRKRKNCKMIIMQMNLMKKMQKRSPKSFETKKESRAKKSKEKGEKKREKKGNKSR